MRNYFFVEAVPRQRCKEAVPAAAGGFIFMPSPSSRSMAKPAAARRLRQSFYFLVD
jgi:hypothetical protein